MRCGIASRSRKKTVSRDRSTSSVSSRRTGCCGSDRSRSPMTTRGVAGGRLVVHERSLAIEPVGSRSGRSSTISPCPRRPSPRPTFAGPQTTIRDAMHRTPTFSSRSLGPGRYLKAELFQRTGSFKARGALNRVRALTRRGARARRDQRLGRKPRAGPRLGGRHRRGRRAARDVAGREHRQDRRHPRLRRRGRPGGGGPGRGVRAAARAAGADGSRASCIRSTTRS